MDAGVLKINNDSSWSNCLINLLIVASVVFSMAMLGILSRPIGLLAAFWPANAVLLGLFVRFPKFAKISSWVVAFLAYIAADIIGGTSFTKTLILTTGNLLGVLVGYFLFKYLISEIERLNKKLSIFYFILVVVLASFVAGLCGMIANPILFSGSSLDGFVYWFTTELVNYFTVLPVLLTLPNQTFKNLEQVKSSLSSSHVIEKIMPVASLFLSMFFSAKVGGPVALSFLMPSLLWCAITYDIFLTAVLTLFCSTWVLIAAAAGSFDIGINYYDRNLLETLRFGVTLISLVPLTVASVMASRNQIIKKLNYASTHDALTGVLNRRGFMDTVEQAFNNIYQSKKSVAIMMIDIDRFKILNDTYGHKVGDIVLKRFGIEAMKCIRDNDFLGRMGGEEFAVAIMDCAPNDANIIAHRICNYFSSNKISIPSGKEIQMTVSIGLVFVSKVDAMVEELIDLADRELYKAKEAGRNRVVFKSL